MAEKYDRLQSTIPIYDLTAVSRLMEEGRQYAFSPADVPSQDILQESAILHHPVWSLADSLTTVQRVELHSHNLWELSFCQKGSAEYLIKDIRYTVSPSDIIIVPPNATHRLICVTSEEPFNRIIVELNPELVYSIIESSKPWQGQVLCANDLEDPAHIQNLFELALAENVRQLYGWENMLTSIGTQLCVCIYRAVRTKQESVPKGEPDLLDRVMHYMCMHVENIRSSGDIAAYFHISDSHLRAIFKKRYNTSIHKFIVQQKLSLAKNLIVEGRSMNEIHEAIGFQDYSSFYKAFKRQYGISPSMYKRMQSL